MMKTVFIRAIEAKVDEKEAVLREAIRYPAKTLNTTRFEVTPATFGAIPKSPFAYWTSDVVRKVYKTFESLEAEGRTAKQGLATADDFRFLRLATEIPIENRDQQWFPFAKGGKFSRYYSDMHLMMNWANNGYLAKAWAGSLYGGSHWSRILKNVDFFLRPGLTWPRRTTSGLSMRAMPKGCLFGDKGPVVFVNRDNRDTLLSLCALTNSNAFQTLVGVQLGAADAAARSYEVGIIQRTPIPELTIEDSVTLKLLAHRMWSLKRNLDTCTEISHAFTLPALLQVDGASLNDRANAWFEYITEIKAKSIDIQAEIDAHCFALYAFDAAERARIEQGFTDVSTELDDIEDEEVDIEPMITSLLSWAVGVAFGRFDIQLATGARALPTEPEPFEPLPPCSPGMLTGENGLPLSKVPNNYPVVFPEDGILVDDLGHPLDMINSVGAVLMEVFGEQSSELIIEAENHLGKKSEGLRAWFAKRFFPAHIKRYSQSRRKAPIYWQLGTPSGSYSIWCYSHRLNDDTFFHLTELVQHKVDHEEGKLNALRQETGPDPSSKQRQNIAAQETFVGELRAFKDEVERVAPLWKPNLNDGIIIHFALLWRLVPHNKPWQKECRKVWDTLQKGDYDWAHLAMHLWPERVVQKCAKDRSLAIAHGLETELWFEDKEGKWKPRDLNPTEIGELIAERSSSAVKAALSALLSAPVQGSSTKRRSK